MFYDENATTEGAIFVDAERFDAIRQANVKTCLVLLGDDIPIKKGKTTLHKSSSEEQVEIVIKGIKKTFLGQITMREFEAQGVNGAYYDYIRDAMLGDFWMYLGRYYPDITLESPVTIVYFKCV